MVGTRIYVGGLSSRAKEYDIDRFFKHFSGVGDIVVKTGFAFVEFDDKHEADDAIYEMNGKTLAGERVTVEKARGTPRAPGAYRDSGRRGFSSRGGRYQPGYPPRRYNAPTRTKYRLIVENLSTRVSWQDLKDFMRQAGEVTYADAHKHMKNEGVIEFASHSDMRNAIRKLDGHELKGRTIRLTEQGESSSSRKRSRSRSVTRSRSRDRSSGSRSRNYSDKDSSDRRSTTRSVTPA